MLLRYYGHSLFTATLGDGFAIAMDPYQVLCEYPQRSLDADIATVSHHHGDHDGVGALRGNPTIIDSQGLHVPREGVRVTGIPTFHDDVQGQKRGRNLVFVVEAEGLRLAHLGDLGHVPTPEQAAAIGRPDILLLPVGGYYTIDAKIAVRVMECLAPRVTIPMHYRTEASRDMPIAPVRDFLDLLGVRPEPMPLCRVTAEDISQRPSVLLMTSPEGY